MTRTSITNREITYLIGSMDRGGAENHLLRIAPRLVNKGWSVTIFCFLRRGELAALAEAAGVEVISGPVELRPSMSRPVRLAITVLSLLKFFGRILFRRPYAVHIFLPAAYWLGAPLVLLACIPRRLMSRRSRNHYLQNNSLARWWERNLHQHMTVLLGNSRQVVADLLEEGADPACVRLIYNGIDSALPPDQSSIREATRSGLGLGGRFVMCCVANLIPYKGHADLIDALILAQSKLPADWLLLIAGRDDGIGAMLQDRANAGGISQHLRFLGSRNDVKDLLIASDLFLLPSHEEGFSNALLEAMSAGLAVIATDVGGNAEAIEDGISGIIVPPHAPAALAAAIQLCANDGALRARLGRAALDRVRENFSIESCVAAYDALYTSLEQVAAPQTSPLKRAGASSDRQPDEPPR